MTNAKPPTAQESVLAALRADIASGLLAPGEQVVQDDIAGRYGVSRVPVREALRILEAEGQLTYHPHRGYFVTELSVEDLDEVYRIRELLEAEALRQAVVAIDDADVDDLEDLLAAVEAATATGDVTEITAANRAFHFAILDACGRPRLVRMIRMLWDATDAYRSVYFMDEANRDRIDAEHRDMIAAMRARDGERLVALAHEHRQQSARAVTARLTSAHHGNQAAHIGYNPATSTPA